MPKTLFCLDDGYLALVVVVLEHSIIIYIKQFVLFAVRDIDLARILPCSRHADKSRCRHWPKYMYGAID